MQDQLDRIDSSDDEAGMPPHIEGFNGGGANSNAVAQMIALSYLGQGGNMNGISSEEAQMRQMMMNFM